MACEVCGGPLRDRRLDADNVLAECEVCGHLERDLTRAPARHRDAAYGGEPALDRMRLDLTYRALRRAFDGAAPPRSVFEIGYGTGALLRRFHDDGALIAGADPDQLGLAVDPVVRAAGRLFPTGIEQVDPGQVQVDAAYGVHVLEHVDDPAQTLRQAYALLRPGGAVQCLTPSGDSDGLRTFGSAWWMLEDPTHVRFFTAESLGRAARAAGFTDVAVQRPVLDSLSTDVASLARRTGRTDVAQGALAARPVLAAAAVTAPVVLAARAVRPRLRPTLHLVARRPT